MSRHKDRPIIAGEFNQRQSARKVLAMRWDQINFDLGLWHILITKNKESQTLPLTDLAMQVLEDRYEHRKSDEWVFPSDGVSGHVVSPKPRGPNVWSELSWKICECTIFVAHLEVTAMNNQSLQIIGKVLGHKSPTATQIYSRLAFDPLKHAMEAAQASMANSADILPAGLFNKKRKPWLKRVK